MYGHLDKELETLPLQAQAAPEGRIEVNGVGWNDCTDCQMEPK
jgi:hypothetical protein